MLPGNSLENFGAWRNINWNPWMFNYDPTWWYPCLNNIFCCLMECRDWIYNGWPSNLLDKRILSTKRAMSLKIHYKSVLAISDFLCLPSSLTIHSVKKKFCFCFNSFKKTMELNVSSTSEPVNEAGSRVITLKMSVNRRWVQRLRVIIKRDAPVSLFG